MAELTWKATLIAAVILTLIGAILATCINYAKASIKSIKAGIEGPFSCVYNSSDADAVIVTTTLCNDTTYEELVCKYVFVSYKDISRNVSVNNIKLTPSYAYNNDVNKTLLDSRPHMFSNGEKRDLGRVSIVII